MKVKIVSIGGVQFVTTKLRFDGDRRNIRGRPRVGVRDGPPGRGGAFVTAAMEAAAVSTFLAQGDPVRLGRALAEVYREMERVRRTGSDDAD